MPIVKEVRDRKLPPNLEPECKASQKKGESGIGHNAKSHAHDMEDFGMAVDTTGREKANTGPSERRREGFGNIAVVLGRRRRVLNCRKTTRKVGP
jgi:hypothetical protein